jgi:hypothetical protein
VLTGRGAEATVASLKDASPWELARDFLLAWIVGSPFVGAVVGAVIGTIVYAMARARLKKSDPWERAFAEVRARFRAARIGVRQYVRWKVRLDPAYRAIAAEVPEGSRVVEIGAGLGILAILLALLGARKAWLP